MVSLKDKIDVCVFDPYGTLFDTGSDTGYWREILGDKADTLVELWRRKQMEYTWWRSLVGAYEDFWHVTGASLDAAMSHMGLNMDATLRSRLMSIFLRPNAHLEVKEVLARLKESGVRTAVLSNGTLSMLVSAVKSADLYGLVDERITADTAKEFNPHPSVFQLTVDHLNVPADRICYLSASAFDAAAGAFFGFKSVWVNRIGQHGEHLAAEPDCEINNLKRLPGLLGL